MTVLLGFFLYKNLVQNRMSYKLFVLVDLATCHVKNGRTTYLSASSTAKCSKKTNVVLGEWAKHG